MTFASYRRILARVCSRCAALFALCLLSVFPLVVLSLLAVRCSVPRMFWDVLSSGQILYSYSTSRMIARDLGNIVMSPTSIPLDLASAVVMLAAYDNCMVQLRTNHEHVAAERCNDKYQTCNWLTRWLPNTYDAEIKEALRENGGWNDRGSPLRVVDALTDYDAFANYDASIWIFFINIALSSSHDVPCVDVLHHPDCESKGADPLVFQFHAPTQHGTARYEDNKILLARMKSMVNTIFGLSLCFVIGDQQSYSRMA